MSVADIKQAADDIITVGERVWNIIHDGKAVSGFESKTVHAIPKGVDVFDLDGWRGPNWLMRRHTTRVEGWSVPDYTPTDIWFKVHWTPFGRFAGGKYKGRGCYLSNMTVTYDGSSTIGSNVTMSVHFGDAVRHGKTNPISGIDVWVVFDEKPRWAKNALHTTYGFHLMGDGSARQIE